MNSSKRKIRIAVLSSATAWHFVDLKRACGSGCDIFNVRFEHLASFIDKNGTGYNIDADAVIVRTMPGGSLQQIVFRMDLLARLEQNGTVVVNPAKSIEAAVDKYLSLTKLKSAGVSVPQTFVSQSVENGLLDFQKLSCDAVVKPIFGSMGNGIIRLQSVDDAQTHFECIVNSGEVIYQQEFIEGAFDLRLFVIGQQVFAMKRTNPKGWITNISQGGIGETYQADASEKQLAIDAARAVGAHIAGVDVMFDSNGQPVVLEVNAVPGWEAIGEVLQVDIAKKILDEVVGLCAMQI